MRRRIPFPAVFTGRVFSIKGERSPSASRRRKGGDMKDSDKSGPLKGIER